ncbi:cation:proton antiporter [Limnobacter parvus]|uniref:Cation:proton antiporter n=1 Tax=Limnobacter parvus TaxID=2939690 RepID=A0ABT1XDH9_9BURK|nr:cation:proton antiporter [Limnobacter parvus]MCR2745342.1 cation:proton antiporter [Limnobacter parvus]
MTDFLPIQNPVFVFTLVLLLILLAPFVMARSRLPGMIGLLLAGALLGPNALNVLARDQSFILFGTVGLLYIMFIAALEIDMLVLKRYGSHSVVFGLLTFAVPMSVGVMLGFVLNFDWPASILLGSIFASHTLLAYPVVSRLGLARNPAVTSAVGGTIITDTLALLVLAVIAASVDQQPSTWLWVKLSLGLVVYMASLLWLLPKLARWFFKLAGEDSIAEFVFVLACVFGAASLSYAVGAEPIVGAFLAGLSLNRLIPQNGVLMNRLRFTGEAVFIPFFLISVGMLLDVKIFSGGLRAWGVALGMLFTIFFTKWAASVVFQRLMGYSNAEAKVVFGLSLAQAAATLAATIVGYNIGLFDEEIVNGAILMIIVTCAFAPWVVEKYGRQMVVTEQAEPANDEPRFERFMVSLSPRHQDTRLVEFAHLLRDPAQSQALYLASVVQDIHDNQQAIIKAEQLTNQAASMLAGAEVPTVKLTPLALSVADGLLRAARENRCTHLVCGWGDRTTTPEKFFGSLQEKLARSLDSALTICRLKMPLPATKRMVVFMPPNAQYEFGFLEALRTYCRLAAQLATPIVFVGEERTRGAIQRGLDVSKIKLEFEFEALANWGEPRKDLVQPDDLLLIHGVREGGVAWQPESVKLSTHLVSKFSRHNVLMHFPVNQSPVKQ